MEPKSVVAILVVAYRFISSLLDEVVLECRTIWVTCGCGISIAVLALLEVVIGGILIYGVVIFWI